MAEWSNAAVLKTVDLHGSGGSNPSLSAEKGVTDICSAFFNFSVTKNVTKIVAIATFHSKKMQVESGDIFITRYSLTLGLTHNKLMKEGVPHDFYIRPGGHK